MYVRGCAVGAVVPGCYSADRIVAGILSDTDWEYNIDNSVACYCDTHNLCNDCNGAVEYDETDRCFKGL